MDLQSLEKDALEELNKVESLTDVDALYIKYLGRKEGCLTKILRNLGTLSPEEKRQIGPAANKLKGLLEEKISSKKKNLQTVQLDTQIFEIKI